VPRSRSSPADPQRDQLARAHAGVGGDPYQRRVPRVDRVGEGLDLDGVEEVHLAPLHLGELDPGGDVAGELAAVDRGVEDLGEHLVGFAGPLGRQAAADESGQPLAHRERVQVGQPRPGERREDLVVEQSPVVVSRARAQRRRGGEPPLGPLAEPLAASGRVDPSAPVASRLVLGKPTGGVSLAGEHLGSLAAGRVAVADPVGRPAVADPLLDRGH
jgi:hypothetical protein